MAIFTKVFLSFFLANAALAVSPTVSISGQKTIVGTATTWRSATPTVNKWLGIPYAQSPPVMFQKATPPKPWKGVKKTTSYSDACYQDWGKPGYASNATQAIYNNPPNGTAPIESTDCLYINVSAPAKATVTSKLPVLFWIYGGGLQGGSAGITYYDGASFAANQNIIVVSFNYRTNVFGQSNSPAISAEDNNVGLWDQRLALQWVHDNVAQFGGDSKKITIWGQSAGAFSVHQLLASPPNPGFAGAILDSNGASTKPKDSSEQWSQLSSLLNCVQTPPNATAELNCIQQVPAPNILSTISNKSLSFHPIIDNLTVVNSIQTTIAAGTAAKVPILIGSNSGEAQIGFSVIGGQPGADILAVANFFGIDTTNSNFILDTIVALGNLAPNLVTKAFTDLQFTCPTRAFAQYLVQNNYQVWRYYFSATFQNTDCGYSDAGAYHASELPIIFGTYPTWDTESDEATLSNMMQTAWANFARNAASTTPGPGLGSLWPPFIGGTVDNPLNASALDIESIANGPDYLGPVKELSVDTPCLLHPALWNYAEASY